MNFKKKRLSDDMSLAYPVICHLFLISFICLLQERTDDDITPMPTYFRFLALLAFKIFAGEQVSSIPYTNQLFQVSSNH